MYATNQFRKGLKIELDKVPYEIVDFQHVSPGKGSAFTRTKLKNIMNGNQIERTFKSGDKVDKPDLEIKEMQFLYNDGEFYHFMDNTSYEQTQLSPSQVGVAKDFMKENISVSICFFEGKAITLDLPNFVELAIKETAPDVRGDTATGGGKPATLETGVVISVPFHLKEGDVIKVDTRDNRYVEKVNK